MSVFDNLDRIVNNQVDRVFAQTAYVTRMESTPNGRSEPKAGAGTIECKGILDTNDHPADIEIGNRDGRGNNLRTVVHGTRYELSVDGKRYPEVLEVNQGDVVTLDDMRKFSVVTAATDPYDRVTLTLRRL